MDLPKHLGLIEEPQSSVRWIDDSLNLTNLPERLDDALLYQVRAIAEAPLPPELACDERHFTRCLRVMISVLPRQQSGDLSAELFIRTYHRQLAGYSNGAITFLAEQATKRCRWFPTIVECVEILEDWRRDDEALARKVQAGVLAAKEYERRRAETRETTGCAPMTQDEVDALTPELRRLGLACGALVRDEDGRCRPAREDEA